MSDDALAEQVGFLQFAVGAISGPMDAWLTTRGIKTLDVRMKRHSENALAIAEFLSSHDRVSRVYYPGLTSHPGHELAAQQMSGFGGIVSVALGTGVTRAGSRNRQRFSSWRNRWAEWNRS